MLFKSLNFFREASFFSRKTAQIIKNTINPPKRIGNAYSIYFMENYPQFKGTQTKMTEISKSLGARWNGLSKEEKETFEKRAQMLKSEYNSQKKDFNQSLSERQKLALNLLNLNRRARNGDIKRIDLNQEHKEFLKIMPEPSATTPRGVFMAQKLKGIPITDGKMSDNFSMAMKSWTELSIKDKEAFAIQAKTNLDSYVEKINTFLKG